VVPLWWPLEQSRCLISPSALPMRSERSERLEPGAVHVRRPALPGWGRRCGSGRAGAAGAVEVRLLAVGARRCAQVAAGLGPPATGGAWTPSECCVGSHFSRRPLSAASRSWSHPGGPLRPWAVTARERSGGGRGVSAGPQR
jgi:hypothetical protein